MTQAETPLDKASIITSFWRAPDEALFDQKVVTAVLGVTEAWAERSRWVGSGPPYKKLGRIIRYRKGDVLRWIDGHSGATGPATPRAAELGRRI